MQLKLYTDKEITESEFNDYIEKAYTSIKKQQEKNRVLKDKSLRQREKEASKSVELVFKSMVNSINKVLKD